MRRWNARISAAILVLLVLHVIAGSFQLWGLLPGGKLWLTVLAWTMTALLGVHAVIGCILTAQTLRAVKRSGVQYFRENRLFWTRRLSGFALAVLLVTHLLIFSVKHSGDAVRLRYFGGVQLATQIMLAAAVAVHVLTNIKPLMLGLGMRRFREILGDILLILSVLLLLACAAMIVYYLRWSML